MPDIKSGSSGLEFADKEGGAELQQPGEKGGAGWVATVATYAQHLPNTQPIFADEI